MWGIVQIIFTFVRMDSIWISFGVLALFSLCLGLFLWRNPIKRDRWLHAHSGFGSCGGMYEHKAGFSYILICIPLSYLIAFTFGKGIVGVWMGIPIGLTLAGILFFVRFRKKLNCVSMN